MPPRRYSRYSFATAVPDDDGTLFLYGAEPYRYRELPDNRQHVVRDGDTLWTLAFRYFRDFPRPSDLYWIIMDFQPEPIHDPTLALEVGRVLIIPSSQTVSNEIFSERRRRE